MKILVTWYDYPSIHSGIHLPAFHMIKHLSKKNEITLLCFRQMTRESKHVTSLEQYCEAIETVDIPIYPSLSYKTLCAIRNTFALENLLAKPRCFFTPYYSPQMCKKFERLVTQKKFDLIYTDFMMAYLSQHTGLPKIAHVFDCSRKGYYERYKNAHHLMSKILHWLTYRKVQIDESMICKNFDAVIVVTDHEKDAMNSFSPTDIRVIPNGVDCEYFKPLDEEEKDPSIVFVGEMFGPPNYEAVLYFYEYIFGYIKKQVPRVKFYFVGRGPVKEVQQLAADETVIVTGYVEDVRSYLAKSSVVVVPMISGRGVKNKVLEAMAMGKAVITTSIGARGIDVTPDVNIIIADEPMVFARRVVELLNNEQLRRQIGSNARRLVETKYSWEKAANALNKLFEEKRARSTDSWTSGEVILGHIK
jgi:sugar transferase (PEP-CTERM/EpsH1 system associated)